MSEVTLLTKHLALVYATTNPKLSACDVAVFAQIMDYFNAEKGYSYPSMQTLAVNVNRSKRAVVDSVSRLTALGFVQITRHGNRATSNRYRPIFHEYTRPTVNQTSPYTVNQTSPHMGNQTSPYMGKSTAEAGEVERSQLVNCGSPELIYNPVINRIVDKTDSNESAAAPPARPGGRLALASDGSKYDAFWGVYPKRQNMKAAENEIDLALKKGFSMDDIVAGASQYADWVKAQSWTELKYVKSPVKFIADEAWRDDWTTKQKKQPTKAPLGHAQARAEVKQRYDLFMELDAKINSCCVRCEKAMAAYEESPANENHGDYCDIGKKLFAEYLRENLKWFEATEYLEGNFNDYYDGI